MVLYLTNFLILEYLQIVCCQGRKLLVLMEWVIGCWLATKWAIFQLCQLKVRTSYLSMRWWWWWWWCPLCTRPTCLIEFLSARSLIQQSVDSDDAPLRHVILILSQPTFILTSLMMDSKWKSNKYQFYNLFFVYRI